MEAEAISPEHLCTSDLMKCARIENHGASTESCIQNVKQYCGLYPTGTSLISLMRPQPSRFVVERTRTKTYTE